MDPRDIALQASCPIVAAPRFGPLPDMPNGQRLIAGAGGLYVQVKLDWLDCIECLTPGGLGIPLPYGEVGEHLRFSFGVLPIRLIESFIDAARLRLPNEAAGALIYSRSTGALRLALCQPVRASPARIEYRVPAMAADESLAVDLHTHGAGPAFWSADDDRDDRGIKVAGVFGHLHCSKPSAEFRLAINGRFRALRHPWLIGPGTEREPNTASPAELEQGSLRRILNRWLGIGHH